MAGLPSAVPHALQISSPIAVLRVDGHYRLVATRDLSPQEVLHRLDGLIVETPDQYSVQVGEGQHLAVPPGVSHEEILDRYAWRFLNHSCAPNATIENRRLRSISPIKAFEQITFDYNTTEDDIAAPFPCSCGEANCEGMIRGFRWLSKESRLARQAILAPHLQGREVLSDREDCAAG